METEGASSALPVDDDVNEAEASDKVAPSIVLPASTSKRSSITGPSTKPGGPSRTSVLGAPGRSSGFSSIGPDDNLDASEQIPDDEAIAWIWARIRLDGFQPEMWRDEHSFIIADFLVSPSITRLTVVVDTDNHRVVLHTDSMPTGVPQLQYFIKDNGKTLLSIADARDAVQYGIVSGPALDNIFAVMTNLYVPTFLNNSSWPASVRKDFSGQLHKFMANLTETVNHSKGSTILYMPDEDLSDVEAAVADKDLIQRLESTLIHWTRQIKEVVTNQDTSQHVEESGPLEEIEFWRSRTVDLLGIRRQLERPIVVDIVRVLQIVGSSYLRPFETLKGMIQSGSDEANDNLRFLETLHEPCNKLKGAAPNQIPPLLVDILNLIRMIWTLSKFYNTQERLTGLLRKVSSQIIKQCTKAIDLNEIFNGDVHASMVHLRESISCGVEWRRIYERTVEAVRRSSSSQAAWNFDPSSIFAQIEAFVQRCRELLEVCEGQVQFARKSSTESHGKTPLPTFGGSRGAETEKALHDIEDAFEKHIERLRGLDYNILDVKATDWHDDYNFFKNGVKDLEVMMTNVISSAFDSVSTVASGVELLEAFAILAKRVSMKTILNRKIADVFTMLKSEVLWIKRDFDRHHEAPPLPPCQPKYAGRALWAHGLAKRIASQRAIIDGAACLANDTSREGREARFAMEQVESVLVAYQTQMYTEWVAEVEALNEAQPLIERLELPLLLRGGADAPGEANVDGPAADDAGDAPAGASADRRSSKHLQANFDKALLRLFDEVVYWQQFQGSEFAIPYVAYEMSKLHDAQRVLYQNVMLVVREYNAVLDALSPDERQLFADHMRKVDRRINPGLTKLTWSKKHVKEFFVKICREQCHEVQALIGQFHHQHQFIVATCRKIAATGLVVIEKSTVYTDVMFDEAQSRHRVRVQQGLAAMHAEIVASMNKSYDIFREAPSDVQRAWAAYIRRIDRQIEAALRHMVKKSLMELSKAIAGDAKNETQALFKVDMVLDEGSGAQTSTVAFRPNMSDLTNLVNDISRKLMNTVKVVPRLTDLLEYKRKKRNNVTVVDSQAPAALAAAGVAPASPRGPRPVAPGGLPGDSDLQNFYDAIANDEDVLKTFVTIIQGMRNVTTDINDLVAYWKDAYKSTWDLDKDAYMRRYANTKRPLSSYDMDITRYKSMQEDVQSEDPSRSVRFIRIDCTQLKASLVAHCLDWQARLTTLLHSNASSELQALRDLIASTSLELRREPKDLEQLGASLNLLSKMKKEAPVIESRFEPLDDMFRTLAKFGVVITDEEKEQLDDLRPSWSQYLTTLKEVDVMLTQVKQSMKRGLEMSLDAFNEAVSENRRAFLASDVFKAAADDGTGIDVALVLVDSWRKRVQESRGAAAAMKPGLDIFGVAQPTYKDLEDTERDLAALQAIWELTSAWHANWQSWKTAIFRQLNPEEMDAQATDVQTRLLKLAKVMKKWPVWNAARERIEHFRTMMPLIKDLKNPAMRERHWAELKEEVQDHQFDPHDDAFTLGKLFDLGIHQHAETINALSAIASREYSIEQTLLEIEERWRTMNVEVVPYKERYRKVVSTDDLFQTLEDHHVSLSTMKNSPHYITFEEQINLWIRRLNDIAECIESVLVVQRQWMYLESIFVGSEDIRKQLPVESALFENVNGSWVEILDRWNATRNAQRCVDEDGLLDRLNRMKATLEKIQKSLDQYLEKKRQIFPRFYFLSDDDLLEVLGQTRDPTQVQRHVKKCFAGIHRLEIQAKERGDPSTSSSGAGAGGARSWEVIGMVAEDGEKVRFLYGIATQGPVEVWLIKVEKSMRETLRKHMQEAVATVQKSMSKRENWIRSTIGQMLITSGQVAWTSECTRALADPQKARKALKQTRNRWYRYLERLTVLIRGDLSAIERLKLVALITIEVHARDVIERMLKHGATAVDDFQWTSQLRFYYDRSEGDYGECQVRQTNTSFAYGYEYQGNNGRLVVTPLTDRCYLTLTTALHLHLGGSPQGPAGTGKTETVKDLGKAMGNFVIVFNCSDAMDYKSLGTLYSGLAQTGAWGCFDEFNRIRIEVLSVVAQQIASIFTAVAEKRDYMMFEGVNIKLNRAVGIFITMNPGYAGRTELPDNLKSLFRPVAMMVPDFALIAEIMLQSEGLKDARVLAQKIVTLYNLMEQQFSKQEHYDFGLRAVKSVLNRAGAIYRESSDLPEDVVLVRALRDMNLPKFVADDAVLFAGLMQDLFPSLEVPPPNTAAMEDSELSAEGLQPNASLIQKIVQLYESKRTRHGNMVVGEALSGKSTAWRILAKTLSTMAATSTDDRVRRVESFVINPKTVDNNELYGSYDLNTREWSDGIIAAVLRRCCSSENTNEKWVVLDGPVDTLWIESMNTVLDDNKVLTLINGDRIALTPQISLLFEVQNLAQASPATVSRAGMVYLDKNGLGWAPFVTSWLAKKDPDQADLLRALFDRFVEPLLAFKASSGCRELIPITAFNAVQSLTRLYDSLATPSNGVDAAPVVSAAAAAAMSAKDKEAAVNEFASSPRARLIEQWFMFCVVWSVGAAVDEPGRLKIDEFLREAQASFPGLNTVYDYVVDANKKEWITWEERVPNTWAPPPHVPMYSLVVPTVDTVRNAFIVSALLAQRHPVLLVGVTGTGKTVLASSLLSAMEDADSKTMTMTMNFSSATSSAVTQAMLESRMEKRQRNSFGPANGRQRLVVFIDDLNMPAPDEFGTQPPNELLRQWIDYGGWYDRQRQTMKVIIDMQVLAAMGAPGGARTPISSRFQSKFNLVHMTFPSDAQIKRIFGTILTAHLANFDEQVKPLAAVCTDATLDLYKHVIEAFLPTPSRSHYIFNLRDMAKVTAGLLLADHNLFDTRDNFIRLWAHECMRVFQDRLVNRDDRQAFKGLVAAQLDTLFATSWESLFGTLDADPLFGTFLSEGSLDDQDSEPYQEMADRAAVKAFVTEKLEFYNMFPGNAAMQLVLFDDAVEHVCRIFRIISQPRGNALLIGVGGSGRQSLTRLAAYIAEVPVKQIEISKSYRAADFRDDLKAVYQMAGVGQQRCVFLITDTQLIHPSFIEDLNSILSSGEIPNLFPPDELATVLDAIRPQAAEAGVPSHTDDGLYAFFINRVRQNVNVVLCMSPVGATFRDRIRMYPALVNNTSIDLFAEWPDRALREVAAKFLCDVDFGTTDESLPKRLAGVFCTAHLEVQACAVRMAQELLRFTYVTPTNYLDLVSGYRKLLIEKRIQLGDAADKLRNGLSKLDESKTQVAEMTVELEEKRKIVAAKKMDCEKLLVEIVSQQRSADEQRKQVEIEAQKTSTEEKECQSIAESAQADLDRALPALERAVSALEKLDKNAVTEIKSYTKPPPIVARVMSAVMVVLGKEASWATAKKELSDANFLMRLKTFDKDNISSATLKKINKYTAVKDFTAEQVVKKSVAAAALCDWVVAIEVYAMTFRTVAPKRAALKDATSSLEIKQKQLKVMQERLARVKEQVAALEQRYESSENEKNSLRKAAELLETKLSRADKLVSGLSSERSRWQDSIAELDGQLSFLVGDCAVAAAFLSYAGAFVGHYRQELVKTCLQAVRKLEVPASPDFNFARFLAVPTDVRDWNIQGLPTDEFSTENGLLVTRGNRWPLMVDPQGQANKWAKAYHGRALRVIDTKAPDTARVLENAVQFGTPVLLQDVGAEIDPSLDPILLKAIITENGRKYLKLGDKKLDYNDRFLFWMTTRLPNPHYPPEVCAKCTVVNFAVKEKGLEDQLLGFLVRLEQPKLEEDKSALVIAVAANKRKLVDLENLILSLLKTASGSLLDDEGLINTLQASKQTSEQVSEDLRVSQETEKQIDAARDAYRPSAVRASLLFFVLNDLAGIDPMYQFSLDAYFDMFRMSIDKSRKPKGTLDVKERNRALNLYHTDAVYKNTCRGLFEKHKLLFSFQMCVKKMQSEGKVNADDYLFLLRGGIVVDRESAPPANPSADWISEAQWEQATLLGKVAGFKSLEGSLEQNNRAWRAWARSECPETATLPGEWQTRIDDLQRMVLLRVFRPDRVVFAARRFVAKNLGPTFVEPPPMDLAQVYADSTPYTPVIFVLSPGVDPSAMLRDLAASSGTTVEEISLGQGQEAPARRLLAQGLKTGFWVFFANCHLSISWMPELEALVDAYCNGEPAAPHAQFRLWLSSDPHPAFPIPILQRGLKITTEPPKGLRANLLRLYAGLKPDRFASALRPLKYRKLVFSLCWFHAVLLERRKFGSLGWNIPYGFNDSDFAVCESILRLYLDEYEETPWEALKYLIAEANYGGRVTDDRDRRLLIVYVDQFFSEALLAKKAARLSPLDTYYIPDDNDTAAVVTYIKSLPSTADPPEAFGQHANADISSQMAETTTLLSTLLSLQPRTADAGGLSREDTTLALIDSLLEQVPAPIGGDQSNAGDPNPLRIVLLQEVGRYNQLLGRVRSSLVNLRRGIKGLVVISPALEQVYDALYGGQVPDMWKTAYPSLKALGPWVRDLVLRIEQMAKWAADGPPKVFWLSGLTFPTGFLTALLQSTARRNGVAIDDLSWEFTPVDLDEVAVTTMPKDGAYIKGMFLEGARWDMDKMTLADAGPMELECRMPIVHFKPVDNKRGRQGKGLYACPLYMYPVRTGTRERPSFMINVDLKSGAKDPTYWTKRGTALLLSLAT
ncbi:AAA+ ATPase domain-containing protein [Plasmodiophora brassicae]